MDYEDESIFTEEAKKNKELREYLERSAQSALEKFKQKKRQESSSGCYLGQIPVVHPAGA